MQLGIERTEDTEEGEDCHEQFSEVWKYETGYETGKVSSRIRALRQRRVITRKLKEAFKDYGSSLMLAIGISRQMKKM